MYPEAGWLERLLGFPTVPTGYEDYIKRVIGLPGETVTIEDGMVWIDGLILEEPYIAESPLYAGTWIVPEDYLFVLGDNRNSSLRFPQLELPAHRERARQSRAHLLALLRLDGLFPASARPGSSVICRMDYNSSTQNSPEESRT